MGQPNHSASTESVSPLSVVSSSCSSTSGFAEERTCAWGMETWTPPHHCSAWERGLGSSGALWGGSTSSKSEESMAVCCSSSAQLKPQSSCKALTLAVVLGQDSYWAKSLGKTGQLPFNINCRGKFNTSQAHVLP